MNRYDYHSKITDIEAAYIAGFIDADGTITFGTSRKRKDGSRGLPMPMVLVVNTDWRIIELMKKLTGNGCAYQTKATKLRPDQDKANWNPVHRYQITGLAAIELCERVYPYLRLKRDRADVLRMCPCRERDFKQKASDEQITLGHRLENKIREMNSRKSKPQPSFL